MSYREFCIQFCGNREIKNLSDQKFLLEYVSVFNRTIPHSLRKGLYVVEPGGIYIPIQDTSQGIVCFSKMPASRQKVYAIHDGYQTVFAEHGNSILIFPNVFEINPEIGYDFINQVTSLYPISATIPSYEKNYYTITTGSETDTASNHSDTSGDDDEIKNYFSEEPVDPMRNYYLSKYDDSGSEDE